MSLARKEVIEIVRDYKTSKHCGECRPLKQAGVMAVVGILWEPSCEYINNDLCSKTLSVFILSTFPHTSSSVGYVECQEQEPLNVTS